MKSFMVTFGQKYRTEPHPKAPAHPDGWVTVKAEDYDAARVKTVNVFGQAWSMLYAEEDFVDSAHFYPLGELQVIS